MKGLSRARESMALAGTGEVGLNRQRPPAPATEVTSCAVADGGAQRDVVFLTRHDPPRPAPAAFLCSRPRPGRCRREPRRALWPLSLGRKSSAGEAGRLSSDADPAVLATLHFIVKEKPSGFEGAGQTDPAGGASGSGELAARSHPATRHCGLFRRFFWRLSEKTLGFPRGRALDACYERSHHSGFLKTKK